MERIKNKNFVMISSYYKKSNIILNSYSKIIAKRFFSAEKDNFDLRNFANLNYDLKTRKIKSMSVLGLRNLCKSVSVPHYAYLNKKELIKILISYCINLKTLLEVPPSCQQDNVKKRYLLVYVNDKKQIGVSHFGITKTNLNVWLNSRRYRAYSESHCFLKNTTVEKCRTENDGYVYLDKELAFFTALHYYPSLHEKLKELCLVFGLNEKFNDESFIGKRDSMNLDLEAFSNQSQKLRAVEIRKMKVSELRMLGSRFRIPKYRNLKKHQLILFLDNRLSNLKGALTVPSWFPNPEIRTNIFLIVNRKGQIDVSMFFNINRVITLNLWLNSKRYKSYLTAYCYRKNTTVEKSQTKKNGYVYLDKELALFTALNHYDALHYKCWELCLLFDL